MQVTTLPGGIIGLRLPVRAEITTAGRDRTHNMVWRQTFREMCNGTPTSSRCWGDPEWRSWKQTVSKQGGLVAIPMQVKTWSLCSYRLCQHLGLIDPEALMTEQATAGMQHKASGTVDQFEVLDSCSGVRLTSESQQACHNKVTLGCRVKRWRRHLHWAKTSPHCCCLD